jgi:hypothetical protein
MKTMQDVVKALMSMAAIYDKQLTQDAADLLVSDLEEHEPELVLRALRLCRLELSRFPSLAEILKRMDVKSAESKSQEIVGTIFQAVSLCGYPGPEKARAMIGEVGWKAVCNVGGWQRVCDTPDSHVSTLRAQLRNAVEAAVEDKSRCDVMRIPFGTSDPVKLLKPSRGMQPLGFSEFSTEDL